MIKNIEAHSIQRIQGNSVFRAIASCSKILNDEKYFNAVKISGQLCFSGQAELLKNPE